MARHKQQNNRHIHGRRIAMILLWLQCVAFCWGLEGNQVNTAPTSAVEITAKTVGLLPAGEEADGILGDYVLRNERIHALTSANLPARKANYATLRGYITPGCLYDLDFLGSDNDQLNIFRPWGLGGMVSYVRVTPAQNGRATAVEVVLNKRPLL